MELISEARDAGINHVLLSNQGSKGWQASIRKEASGGYIVAVASDPSMALFGALQQAGVVDGPTWRHPCALTRLNQALDANILTRWKVSA